MSIGAAPVTPPGEAAGAVYVLTHVDVFPAGKDEAAALVKTLAEDSRKAHLRRSASTPSSWTAGPITSI